MATTRLTAPPGAPYIAGTRPGSERPDLWRFANLGEALVAATTSPEIAGMLTRAYAGATTGDSVSRPAYVADDLSKITAARPTLAQFATGRLPDTGKNVEYPKFQVTGDVTETAEGADLTDIAVTVDTELAPVKVVGGKTEMTMQAYGNADYVNRVAAVQLRAYARRSNALAVAALGAATGVSAITLTSANKVKASGWVDLASGARNMIEDSAAVAVEASGWVLSRADAATLLGVVDSSSVPVFAPQGQPYEKINGIRPIAYVNGIPVFVDKLATTGTSHIIGREAFTVRETSPVDLGSADVRNLSKVLSLYGYLALEPSDVGAIVRVTHA